MPDIHVRILQLNMWFIRNEKYRENMSTRAYQNKTWIQLDFYHQSISIKIRHIFVPFDGIFFLRLHSLSTDNSISFDLWTSISFSFSNQSRRHLSCWRHLVAAHHHHHHQSLRQQQQRQQRTGTWESGYPAWKITYNIKLHFVRFPG